MDKLDVVRAWKDPAYRATLSPEQLARVPANPAGMIEVTDERLTAASGGVLTTAMTCTEYTFRNWKACCP